MVDNIFEPFMAKHSDSSFLKALFGSGLGSGAAVVMFILGVTGSLFCILAGRKLKKYHYSDKT